MMSKTEKLSNKELVEELMRYTPQVAQCEVCVELSTEILRRLNEPWRALKEGVSTEHHDKTMKTLIKAFYGELDGINFQQSMRHQIYNIRGVIQSKVEELKL